MARSGELTIKAGSEKVVVADTNMDDLTKQVTVSITQKPSGTPAVFSAVSCVIKDLDVGFTIYLTAAPINDVTADYLIS